MTPKLLTRDAKDDLDRRAYQAGYDDAGSVLVAILAESGYKAKLAKVDIFPAVNVTVGKRAVCAIIRDEALDGWNYTRERADDVAVIRRRRAYAKLYRRLYQEAQAGGPRPLPIWLRQLREDPWAIVQKIVDASTRPTTAARRRRP